MTPEICPPLEIFGLASGPLANSVAYGHPTEIPAIPLDNQIIPLKPLPNPA